MGVRDKGSHSSSLYPEFFTVMHFATACPAPLPNKKLTSGQPLGGMSACRLGGQAALGLEGEQSTLECCFWKAIPRSGSPWPWLTDKALGLVTYPRSWG